MNRQEMEYYARKYGILLIIGVSLLLFLLPLLLRLLQGSPITPGPESYLHLRYADLVGQGGYGWDQLHEQRIAPNPYVLLLSLMQLFGVPWLLPLLLAILFGVLLYYYLSRTILARALVLLTVLVLLLTPSMSLLATHHTTTLLGMVFILSAMLLFRDRPIIACFAVGLAILTTPVLGTIAAVFFAAVFFRRGQIHEVIGLLLTTAAAFVWYLLWTGVGPAIGELLRPSFDTHVFFELGNPAGISIFLLVLAGYGIAVQFGKNNEIVLYTLLLLVATFFIPSLLPIAVVALSLFAARGIYNLMTIQWDLELLQSSLLVLIACVGLFLFITSVRERVGENPDAVFAHAMTTLRNQHREGAVLTAPQNAPMIEYFSGRRATVDSSASPQTVQDVFYSRSPGVVYPILANTETSYILVTDEMRREMFRRSDDGLLFLLRNTEQFVKVDDTEGNTLYYFIKPR